MASSITNLEDIRISFNEKVLQGVCFLGRLPNLKILYTGTLKIYSENTEQKDWTAIALTKQLRRLSGLRISTSCCNLDLKSRPP